MRYTLAVAAFLAIALSGCAERGDQDTSRAGQASPSTAVDTGGNAPPPAAPERQAGLVTLRAVGLTFDGPAEIPSGWTTFRFENASSMIHFAMIDVPPAELTAWEISATLMDPFQAVMDAMNAGDDAAVEAAFGRFPEWIGELGRSGGPGLLSPGLTGETTVYLEPGRYLLECYVKTDGVFHTTSPGEGQLGMVMDLTVTGEENGAREPVANATLSISNSGFEITGGALRAGTNIIGVEFREQQALPSFVGNDVHLLRVEGENSLDLADAWMDWRTPQGLQSPSPVVFLGGVQDMPAGSRAYFRADLAPGDYAFIAEVPGPRAAGLVLPFSVK